MICGELQKTQNKSVRERHVPACLSLKAHLDDRRDNAGSHIAALDFLAPGKHCLLKR